MQDSFNQEDFNRHVRESFQVGADLRKQADEEARLQQLAKEEYRFQQLCTRLFSDVPAEIKFALQHKLATRTIGWMPWDYVSYSDEAKLVFVSEPKEERLRYLTDFGVRLFDIFSKAGLTVYPEEGDDEVCDDLDKDEQHHDYTVNYFNLVLDLQESPAAKQLEVDTNKFADGNWHGTQRDPDGSTWTINQKATD